jgi:U3 small nucleolar RNA-associated protein 10
MTSAFAAQLGQIAATSTNELDLKAQKASHSESLVFERKVAGSQDFEAIYQICLEGFQDLCQLDQRFVDFQRNVFNAQSKDQDRLLMTTQENQALDSVLEQFLCLVGSRLLLRPAVKALEWLIRRFKVHTYNTSYLISTFLPYHETPIFQSLLSILPADLPVLVDKMLLTHYSSHFGQALRPKQ